MSRRDRRHLLPFGARAALLILSMAGLVWLVAQLDGAVLGAWGNIGSLCMGLAKFVLEHLPEHAVSAGAAAALVLAGVLALSSIVQKLHRSRAMAQSLLQCEVARVPEALDGSAARLGLTRQVRVVDSSDFHAFCFGLLRPQICISTAVIEELTPLELEAVLRHESWHVRRRDPLRAVIADALATGLFFVPVLREFVRAHFVDRELKADSATVQEMRDAYPLASALHNAATRWGAVPEPVPAAAGAFSALDARIDHLIGGTTASTRIFRPRPLAVYTSLLSLLFLSVLICLFVASWQIGAGAQPCLGC